MHPVSTRAALTLGALAVLARAREMDLFAKDVPPIDCEDAEDCSPEAIHNEPQRQLRRQEQREGPSVQERIFHRPPLFSPPQELGGDFGREPADSSERALLSGEAARGASQIGSDQFGPGQIGSDQFGPDQFGVGQYGSDQYDSGQFDSSRFGPSRFGPGQFGPGQFGSGQFGSGQFGSGQFGSGQFDSSQHGAPLGPPQLYPTQRSSAAERYAHRGDASILLPPSPRLSARSAYSSEDDADDDSQYSSEDETDDEPLYDSEVEYDRRPRRSWSRSGLPPRDPASWSENPYNTGLPSHFEEEKAPIYTKVYPPQPAQQLRAHSMTALGGNRFANHPHVLQPDGQFSGAQPRDHAHHSNLPPPTADTAAAAPHPKRKLPNYVVLNNVT